MRWIWQEIHIQINLFQIKLWRSSDDLSAIHKIANKWVFLRHLRLRLPLGSMGLRPNKRVYIKTLLTKQHKRNTTSGGAFSRINTNSLFKVSFPFPFSRYSLPFYGANNKHISWKIFSFDFIILLQLLTFSLFLCLWTSIVLLLLSLDICDLYPILHLSLFGLSEHTLISSLTLICFTEKRVCEEGNVDKWQDETLTPSRSAYNGNLFYPNILLRDRE